MELLNVLYNFMGLVFVLGTIVSMGLSLTIKQITGPLRNIRFIIIGLLANFVIPPIFAVILIRVFALYEPLSIGLLLVSLAAGASIFSILEHSIELITPGVRWLLVGTVSLTLLSTALLTRTIQFPKEHARIYKLSRRVMIVSAFLVFLLGVSSLETIPLLAVVLAMLLAPVFSGFRVWLETLEGSTRSYAGLHIFQPWFCIK